MVQNNVKVPAPSEPVAARPSKGCTARAVIGVVWAFLAVASSATAVPAAPADHSRTVLSYETEKKVSASGENPIPSAMERGK